MKNITRNGILLGLGILATSPFITSPASAAPGHKQERRQVVRKTVVKRTVVRRPVVVRHPQNLFRTIQGSVTKNLDGNDFILQLNNGRTQRVIVPSGEPRGLSRGDIVQATGQLSGGVFRATRATILRNR